MQDATLMRIHVGINKISCSFTARVTAYAGEASARRQAINYISDASCVVISQLFPAQHLFATFDRLCTVPHFFQRADLLDVRVGVKRTDSYGIINPFTASTFHK